MLNLEIQQYLPYYWSNKGFKGTVVNQTLPSFSWGSLEITPSVLKKKIKKIITVSKFTILHLNDQIYNEYQ